MPFAWLGTPRCASRPVVHSVLGQLELITLCPQVRSSPFVPCIAQATLLTFVGGVKEAPHLQLGCCYALIGRQGTQVGRGTRPPKGVR